MYIRPRRKVLKKKSLGGFGYRPKITAQQFRDARVDAGLTRQQAADMVGVSLRTVGHWETEKARPTYAAFKLLRVLRHGDLIDPKWSGYRLIRGKLVSPENHSFEPSDMTWWSLTVRMAHAFRENCRRTATAEGRGVLAGVPTAPRPVVPALSQATVGGHGEGRGEAPALGLVYIGTSDTQSRKTLAASSFSPDCNGAIMGPQLAHEQSENRDTKVQFEAASGSHGRGKSPSRSHRRVVQRLRAVRGFGAGQEGPQADTGGQRSSNAEGDCLNNCHASGRKERPMSVRKRAQSKALPPGKLLTGGAL